MSKDAKKPDHRAVLTDALRSVERMQEKLAAADREKNEPIAVVGMGCQFPGGAEDPAAFWDLLRNGIDAACEVPADRWDMDAYFDEDPTVPGTIYAREGGFLQDISCFDARFFGISPREARTMDPQQRMVLEVCWQALEWAGIAGADLRGTQTGVFVGIGGSDFAQLQAARGDDTEVDAYTGTGGGVCFAAGRVSYVLGLEGPSMIVDTACSSSLVAVHLACESLRRGECTAALAAGVNIILAPQTSVFLSRTGALAPDGRCKAFDASADGFARGEGCGAVVLKRLSDATRDGDTVHGVILGSAVNQDGKSSGITVPNGPAQQAVIRQALDRAGVAAHDVGYLEAHGTGTPLGDPIELGAAAGVLAKGRDSDSPLVVGSVKTNIGHLEAAAGIAGLIKAILSVREGFIPQSLHFHTLNPEIFLKGAPVVVAGKGTNWPEGASRRVAGVSAFGLSGTNAHVVLAEAPGESADRPDALRADRDSSIDRQAAANGADLLTLSAWDEEALGELRGRLEGRLLEEGSAFDIHDVCATFNTGRSHFEHRVAIVADSTDVLAEVLNAAKGADPRLRRGHADVFDPPSVAFLFTGQGSQHPGMGRTLFETEPVFRRTLERCHEILEPQLDVPLLSLLYDEGRDEDELDQTAYTQPALFSIEYSLAELWKSWGVRPSAVLGHSVGEFVAACLAGVFSLEDALHLVATRGRLMQSLPSGGAMAAVLADEERVKALLPSDAPISIAALNGPHSTVLSGAAEAVRDIVRLLETEGVDARELKVSHAFHSSLMDPILDDFERAVAAVERKPPTIGLVSNTTGRFVDGPEITTARYWRDHIRSSVRFRDSMETLRDEGYSVFLEVGPHSTLTGLGKLCLEGLDACWATSLRRGKEDRAEMLEGLADMYVSGATVNWSAFRRNRPGRRVSLPTYPFARTRFPILPETGDTAGKQSVGGRRAKRTGHPFLGNRVDVVSAPGTHIWDIDLDLDSLSYLEDHRVEGAPVFPASAYMEIAMGAVNELSESSASGGERTIVLRNVRNENVLLLDGDSSRKVQLEMRSVGDSAWDYSVHVGSQQETDTRTKWTLLATGSIERVPASLPGSDEWPTPEEARSRCENELSGALFYQHMKAVGNEWGPSFQGVEKIWRGGSDALAFVRPPKNVEVELNDYVFHPALADSTGHALSAASFDDLTGLPREGAVVARGIDEVRIHRRPTVGGYWAYARLREPEPGESANTLVGDVVLFDESGEILSETLGVRLRYLEEAETFRTAAQLRHWLHEIRWEEVGSAAPVDRESAAESSKGRAVEVDATAGRWLILADEQDIGRRLAEHAESQGLSCTVAIPGSRFERVRAGEYTVDLWNEDSVDALLSACAEEDGPPLAGIVHLLSLDTWDGCDASVSQIDADTRHSCGTALLVTQAIVRTWPYDPPRLWLVTRGAQPAGHESAVVSPAQAALWGYGRTVSGEHPELWGGLIDLDPSVDIDTAAVLRELLSTDGEDQIALRGANRLAPRVSRIDSGDTSDDEFSILCDATYLVTGATGGIGLHLIRWLTGRGARHIALVARSEPGHEAASVFEELRREGVEVSVFQADVAHKDQLARILESIDDSMPVLRGVFHLAGVVDDAVINRLTWEKFERVFGPKVQGTWNLHDLTKDRTLDVFAIFASGASFIGGAGQANYAAANAFQDAVALHRRSLDLPAVSIDWGPWAQTGMASVVGTDRVAQWRRAGMDTMPVGAALRVLDMILAEELAHVAVLPVDWPVYTASLGAGRLRPIYRNVASEPSSRAGAPGLDLASLLRQSGEDRQAVIGTYAAERMAAVLGLSVDQLDVKRPISAQGFDSIMAIELKNRMESDLGIIVPLVRLLDGPSATELTQLLVDRLDETTQYGVDEAAEDEASRVWEEGEI